MKNTAIPLLSVVIPLLSACAGSFAQMRSAVNQAPEWYAERRTEIRGEGYPAIADVPRIDAANPPGATLTVPTERIAALRAVFDANPRADMPPVASGAIEALVSDVQAEFADVSLSSNMLTEADIAAIRESFNVPRVTQGSTIRR